MRVAAPGGISLIQMRKIVIKKKGSMVMNNNLGTLVRVGIIILLLLLSLGFLGQSGVMGSWG